MQTERHLIADIKNGTVHVYVDFKNIECLRSLSLSFVVLERGSNDIAGASTSTAAESLAATASTYRPMPGPSGARPGQKQTSLSSMYLQRPASVARQKCLTALLL